MMNQSATRVTNKASLDPATLLTARYSSPIDCAVRIVRAEGFLALYSGFSQTVARLGPWQFIFFLTYEKINMIMFGESGI